MRIYIAILSIFVASCAAGSESAQVFILNNNGYDVVANKIVVSEVSGCYESELEVRFGSDTFESVMLSCNARNENEFVSYMKEKTYVFGDDIFIETSCGGGRQARCDIMSLYSASEGRARYLGHVISQSLSRLQENRVKAGARITDKVYFDLCNELEVNDFVSMANSPLILVALEDVDGKLEISVEKTYKLNKDKLDEALLKVKSAVDNNYNFKSEEVDGYFLFAMALTKLTGRHADYLEINKLAGAYYDVGRFHKLSMIVKDFHGQIVDF